MAIYHLARDVPTKRQWIKIRNHGESHRALAANSKTHLYVDKFIIAACDLFAEKYHHIIIKFLI